MTTATTREIPREEWVLFFNVFSRRHDRWLVTLEILGSDFGDQIEGRSLRFEGINADLKGGENRITIDLGEGPDGNLSHAISRPTRVWLGQIEAEMGTFETLEIESEDGRKTLVRFLAGALPDES